SVRVDGPYGRPCIPFKTYCTVVMFAGGSGVTPMLSIVRDALHSLRKGLKYHSVQHVCV
ncbi:unnamed protein product, partial [Choristocarpus tenellus]